MDYPEELRGDVSLHLHKEILSLPIFETASEGCRKLLSLKIKTNFCAPDEFLIHKGDALQNIFYLYNGSMEVLQEGMVVAILGEKNVAYTHFVYIVFLLCTCTECFAYHNVCDYYHIHSHSEINYSIIMINNYNILSMYF